MEVRRLIASLVALGLSAAPGPVSAQMQPLQTLGVDAQGQPWCQGPLGPGRCADVVAWMQRGGPAAGPFQPAGPPLGPIGPTGIPTGVVTGDGQLVAEIAQDCRGEPRCIAAAWGTVEVQRCAQGVGVPGGCFGPNGEIMKVINRIVPQNLQPNVILHNLDSDLRNGPGRNNDLVGKDGWVCRTLFGGC